MPYWTPQIGPQAAAATCPADETFYGGTRGGGKSDTAIGRQVRGAERYGPHWNGLFIRRKYKDLAEVRRRFDELIAQGMPAIRVGGENQTNYVRFTDGPATGAVIVLAAILKLEMADAFQGHQYTEITIDEAPTIPFIGQLIDRMKGCLRSPHGVPCRMFLTGNPGGSGASQAKQMYIPEVDGGMSPVGDSEIYKLDDGTTRVFIRSTVYDNAILCDNDPKYVQRLQSIKDPVLRKAWLDGRWDVFIGQAFNFTERHIIDPIWPIPEFVPLYMTFDWGFGAPFHIGWWWVDQYNRLVLFAEWYGCEKGKANVGLRLEDPKIAEGILEREQKMGILGRNIKRLVGHDSFNKKPDYKGGGQGDSTADEFIAYASRPEVIEKYGSKINLNLLPGDPNRELKIRQFRNRLMLPDDPDERPMLVVYRTCKDFIRIIPDLCTDELTGEYLENGQELHPFDSACHICMDRPVGLDEMKIAREREERRLEQIRSQLDAPSRAAADEFAKMVQDLKEKSEERFDVGIFMN